jgi:hypothetical protein
LATNNTADPSQKLVGPVAVIAAAGTDVMANVTAVRVLLSHSVVLLTLAA